MAVVVGVSWIAAPVAATAAVTRQPVAAPNVASSAASAQVATSVPPGTEVVPLYADFALHRKATFQPSSGEWRFTAADGAPVLFRWGQAGDVPVVGDFNGNAAVDDLAVWRPSNGTWYIWYDGGTGIQVERQWGAPGDIPLVGDFNANSSHDLAVWRPSNGTWYIWYDGGYPKLDVCQPIVSNRGCQASFGWGLPGDIPVAANYAWHDGSTSSGSGPDDLAVWRPSNGTWYIWYDAGTGTQVARQWGAPGDVPLPGKYGNDFGTDLTIYRPSTGTWWIWHGAGTNTPGPAETRAWGQAGDIPLRFGGKWGWEGQIAVYRPSDESWHVEGGIQPLQPATAAAPVATSAESDNSPAMPLTTSAIQAVGVTALEDCERTRTGCGGGGGGGGGGGEPVGGCNPELTQESVNPNQDNPEFGGRYSTVMFGTRLACTSGIQLTSVRIQTQLWDRTGGGRINALAKAPERTSINVDSAQTVDLYDVDYYPAAQQAEVVQLAQLDAGPGRIWQCNNNATLSFLWCSGVGTRYLSAVVGFGSFSTGVGPPARTFGGQGHHCSPNIQKSAPRDDANKQVKVAFFAQINCGSNFAPQIQMVMDLYDRTPGQNDAPLRTRISGGGTGSVTLASEPVTLLDLNYPKGSQAEVVIEAILRTTDGSKWTGCRTLPPGLRYARPCEITTSASPQDTLKVFVGNGAFPTGVQQPPPPTCKEDHKSVIGRYPATTHHAITVTPHIKYCGYFDWGINSRVTSVEKIQETQIWIAPQPSADLQVCSTDFVPQGIGGTILTNGPDMTLVGQVLFQSTKTAICGGATFAKHISFERLYKRDGSVLYIAPEVQ